MQVNLRNLNTYNCVIGSHLYTNQNIPRDWTAPVFVFFLKLKDHHGATIKKNPQHYLVAKFVFQLWTFTVLITEKP